MPRNWSKTVAEGNGPIPQLEEFGPNQSTLAADVYRLFEEKLDTQLNPMKSRFDRQGKKLNELMERRQARQGGSVQQAWSKNLSNHVLPGRQTYLHKPRLASARRAPLQQNE